MKTPGSYNLMDMVNNREAAPKDSSVDKGAVDTSGDSQLVAETNGDFLVDEISLETYNTENETQVTDYTEDESQVDDDSVNDSQFDDTDNSLLDDTEEGSRTGSKRERPKKYKTKKVAREEKIEKVDKQNRKLREAKNEYEKGGSSIFKIAKELAIPYSTLQDYIQNGTCVKGRGRKSIVMSDAEEQKVVQFVIKRAELGCGVGWDQLRNIIQEVLISLCNANPNRSSTFEQSGHLPNRSFVRRFAERQNLVLLRTMELSKGRQILTTADLSMWQEHTQERLLGDPRLAECFKDPRRLFNQDETSVVLGSQQRVLAARGTKVLYSTSSGSREHITASFCVSASGGIVPPRIVLRGKRNLAGKNLEGLEIEGLSGQWNFSVAPKGYVVRETMLEIILDLAKYIEKNSIPTPVVLVIDGAQPHISIEAAELCEQYKIQPWLLKPNMSHILQPLDLSFFSSLKKAMSKLVFQWQSNPVHAGQYLNKYTVVHLLREATEKCLQNKSLIAQGFKRAGLFPWDPSKPDKSKLKPSSIYASGSGSPKLSPESERDGVQTDREDSEELRSPLDKPGDSINVLGQCVEGDGHILKLNDGAGDSAEEVEVQVEEGAVVE